MVILDIDVVALVTGTFKGNIIKSSFLLFQSGKEVAKQRKPEHMEDVNRKHRI